MKFTEKKNERNHSRGKEREEKGSQKLKKERKNKGV
jgi:hypothetical protein